MRRIVFALVAVGALAGAAAYIAPVSGQDDGEVAPIFGVKLPPGYRDWRLISVAHEKGSLNDLRAILGNDIAIAASREGKLPFPDAVWWELFRLSDLSAEDLLDERCGLSKLSFVAAVGGTAKAPII